MKLVIYFIILCEMVACAGYQVKQQSNPFKKWDIHALAIPQFLNSSPYPALNAKLTEVFFQKLSNYPDLYLSSQINSYTDAVLIGVVEAPFSQKDNLTVKNHIISDNISDSANGVTVVDATSKRPALYVPSTISYKGKLKLYVVKVGQASQIEYLKTNPQLPLDSKQLAQVFPNIMIHHSLEFEKELAIEIFQSRSSNDGGSTNLTKNTGNFYKSYQEVADDLLRRFQIEVLDVF